MDFYDKTNELEKLKTLVERQLPSGALDTATKLADMELKMASKEWIILELSKTMDAVEEELAVSLLVVLCCFFHCVHIFYV